jgi:hypothetical protein
MSNTDSLDWNALLQKTEETLGRVENAFGPRDQLLEIDKERGVEQAYYEGDLKECENLINKMEAELNNPEDRRHTSPVQGARDAPVEPEHLSSRTQRLLQQFGGERIEKDEERPHDFEGSGNTCDRCGQTEGADIHHWSRLVNPMGLSEEEEVKHLEEEIQKMGGVV